jgi:hypothetical protein
VGKGVRVAVGIKAVGVGVGAGGGKRLFARRLVTVGNLPRSEDQPSSAGLPPGLSDYPGRTVYASPAGWRGRRWRLVG